jgi:hypothetical protein
MPRTPKILTARPDQVHHIQARLAFLTDNEQARPALLHSLDGDRVELRSLAGNPATVVVHQADRLAAVLERDDLCRLHGEPLVFVNPQYRVLAVATGPATPPSKLEMLIVCELDDEGGVVELLSAGEDQPAWQTFALVDDVGGG